VKWIKYIALPLIVLIFASAVALVIVLTTLDDDDYLRIAQQLILKTTGTELAVAGEFSVALGWETVIQAQGVTLDDPNRQGGQRPLADLQDIKIKAALWPLIHRTLILKELAINDAVITLLRLPESTGSDRNTPPRAEDKGSLPFFLPVIEQMQINRVAIRVPKRNPDVSVQIWIERFEAKKKGLLAVRDQVALDGQGRIDDMAYRIDGTIGTLETFLDKDQPYPLDVVVATLALTTHVQGSVQHGLSGGDLRLQISSQGPELAQILGILGVATPSLGKVDLSAAVSGPVQSPQITALKLTINNPSGLELTATGAIKAPLHFQKVDLALAGTCRDPVLLAWLLPEAVPPVNVIELKGFLKERQRSFYLECAPLTLTGPHGARLVGNGNIWVGRLQGASGPKNQIDLQLDLEAPSVAAPFKADALTDVLKQLRPVKVTGTLKGLFTDLALNNVTLRVGDFQTNTIEANGAIDRICVKAEHPVTGVLFKGNLTVTDPGLLLPDLGAKLSSLGPLSSSFKVTDTNGALNLDDMVVGFGEPSNLEVAVKGSWSVWQGTSLKLNTRTSATALAGLPGLAGLALPNFKAIDLHVEIAQQEDRWDMNAFEARCYGAESEALRIKGNVSDLWGADRTVLTVELSGDLTQEIYPRKGPRFDWLEQVQGRAVISLDPGGYTVEKLNARCDGLTVQATGTIKPAKGSYSGNLQVDVLIADPQIFLAAYGIKWPQAHAFHINGQLSGNDRKPTFSGQAEWGANQTTTTLAADLTGARPRIEIELIAKSYQVEGLRRKPQAKGPAPKKFKRKKVKQLRRLFSERPLDLTSVGNLDLLLRIQARKMSIADLDLEAVDLNFRQVEGCLTLDPLSFKYAGGVVGLKFALDTSKPAPDWHVDLKAKRIDLEQVITEWDKAAQIGGNLNLVLNLKSQGNSVYDIAAGLSGDAGFAVDQGWVPIGVDLLAADVFDALLTIPTTRKNRKLNCLVARFDFEKGIGNSRILSMDTDDFSALGGGTINLRNETLDLLINPKQKKRLVLRESSPVRIFGPLTDLSFSKMPYREAAKLYGDIIIPVIGISDRVLGYLWDAIKPAPGEASPCYVAPGQEE